MPDTLDEILKEFEKCSLSELDTVKLMNRVDTKYVLNKKSLLEVMPRLVKNYKCLEIDGKSLLSYKNLYFDDDELICFQDHHRKIPNRFKVRIRKYIETDTVFLEVKKKHKGRTNKTRVVIKDFVNSLKTDHISFINETIGSNCKLIPSLWNDFQRITLVNKAKTERLTLDFNLAFEFNDRKKAYPNIVIAELKQSNVNRTSDFYQELKRRLIRPYKVSKYCVGSMNIYNRGVLKTNRFKQKDIYINKLNNAC